VQGDQSEKKEPDHLVPFQELPREQAVAAHQGWQASASPPSAVTPAAKQAVDLGQLGGAVPPF